MRLLLILGVCAAVGAHTFHYSKTEMNWNTAARTLEIVVTLHADDIEAQLRKTHRQLELDRDKEAEGLVCAYTAGALGLGGARCIGMKVGKDSVEVYLEMGVAGGPPARLTNRIFVEELGDRRNELGLKKDGGYTGPRNSFNDLETEKDLRW